MPLPWLMVFFMVFLCFFTITFVLSSNYLVFSSVCVKKVSKSSLVMPW